MKRPAAILFFIFLLGEISMPAFADSDTGNLAATIGKGKNKIAVTMAELDERAKTDLAPFAQKVYNARKKNLNQLIEDKLFEMEAEKQKTTAAKLKKEIATPKKSELSDDALEVYYDLNQAKFAGKEFKDVKPQIRRILIQNKATKAKNQFLAKLKKRYAVTIHLTKPEGIKIPTEGRPSRGPKDAPVQLIEFSDFQCPFCGRAKGTMDQLFKNYPKDIRHVYMNNPLPFHKNAIPAAKAAECAHRQGKFWEMRDKLFGNQKALLPANLKQYAQDIGMDMGRYDTCLQDPKLDDIIKKGQAYARSVGARGTPGFYINGQLVSGAQPYSSFETIVKSELGR